MSLTVFLLVLAAALLHALWNAMLKGSGDKQITMLAVVIGHLPLALLALLFVEAPAAQSLPYMLASIALHTGYQLFLTRAYRVGDLSQVYPIARGIAPLIVITISVVVLNVNLSLLQSLAVVLLALGIMSLCFDSDSSKKTNYSAAGLAVVTGCFIAAYSIVDGLGARQSESSVAYYSYLSIGNAMLFSLITLLSHRKGQFTVLFTHYRKHLLIGGSFSFIAYACVTWAFTQAPIALVTALRETSILFALLIGVFHLKERLSPLKLISCLIAMFGAALIRL